MKKLSMFLVVALAVGLLSAPGLAEFKPSSGEIKGYMINEYYSVLSHHNEEIEGRHGFWFRRIYFTYNNKLTDNIKMRLRFEMNSPGDFVTSTTLNALVKDAYLNFKLSGQDVKVGIISPPTYDNIEEIWGYRVLEKTPLDLFKLRSSRDFGVVLKGNLDSKKTISYEAMVGNGSANKAEIDKGKIFYGQLGFKPAEGLYLEVYGDYETQKDDKSYFVYQGFASYQDDWGRVGVQYSNMHFKQEIEGEDDMEYDYQIFSAFAVIKAAKDLELIGRYDRAFGDGFENNFRGYKISYIPFADNAVSNLFIGAVSWNATKNVWLIPNIKYVFYDKPEEGQKPSEDIYANLTLWFKF